MHLESLLAPLLISPSVNLIKLLLRWPVGCGRAVCSIYTRFSPRPLSSYLPTYLPPPTPRHLRPRWQLRRRQRTQLATVINDRDAFNLQIRSLATRGRKCSAIQRREGLSCKMIGVSPLAGVSKSEFFVSSHIFVSSLEWHVKVSSDLRFLRNDNLRSFFIIVALQKPHRFSLWFVTFRKTAIQFIARTFIRYKKKMTRITTLRYDKVWLGRNIYIYEVLEE